MYNDELQPLSFDADITPEDYISLMFDRTDLDGIVYIPGWHYDRVLEHQIKLMQERIEKLQNRISFARGMLMYNRQKRKLRHPLFVANPGKMRYNVFKTKHTDRFQYVELTATAGCL